MARDCVIQVRCSLEERNGLVVEADREGRTLSDYVRRRLFPVLQRSTGESFIDAGMAHMERVAANKIPLLQTEATSPNPFRKPKRAAKHPPRCSCFDCVRARKLGGE